MTRRKLLIFIGAVSILLGGLIYVLFRSDTYIANFFSLPFVEDIQNGLVKINCNFVKFYFPDFLWALSLSCFLLAIFNPEQIGVVLCSTTSLFLGILWETGQFFGAINGTGDFIDIVMYLLASVFALFISTKEKLK